jgi:uncharacterized protein with GYD domain
MVEHAEDRAKAVADLFEHIGGKLLAFHVTFGEHDWLSIVEVPDAEAELAALLAGMSKGAVSDMRTMLAVTPEAFRRACQTAGKLAPGFKGTGSDETATART